MNNNLTSIVSVGLPVVKTEFLQEALEFFLNQLYFNTEILIVNNASNNIVGDKMKIDFHSQPKYEV